MSRLTNFPPEAETRGIAIVGESLSFGLVNHLANNGIISKQDASDIMDQTLLSLEEVQNRDSSDQSVQAARVILDGMIRIFRENDSQHK